MLFSGVVAFLVNLSIYWIIGNTSAVTYPFKILVFSSFSWSSKPTKKVLDVFFLRHSPGFAFDGIIVFFFFEELSGVDKRVSELIEESLVFKGSWRCLRNYSRYEI